MKTMLHALSIMMLSLVLSQAKDPEGEKSDKKLPFDSKSLEGFWILDEEVLLQQMLQGKVKELKDGSVTKEEVAAQAKEYSGMMVIHYAPEGKTVMYTVSGVQKATYKIVSIRDDKGELDLDITSEKSGLEKGTVKIKNNRMKLSPRGQGVEDGRTVAFERVSEEKAQTLIENLKK